MKSIDGHKGQRKADTNDDARHHIFDEVKTKDIKGAACNSTAAVIVAVVL